ncbi:PQQ-dependent catabolism-associated CXXCW motif protein [Oryzibacter oryziterrae]|uniref:PQQ-dependent catabolism-associated CXXCW motif protein n=1 Tax=Oryzibacter oryziterrae TaxID=2766474 RepID=UPI001F3D17EA|nr:PQQ-dependent catabolism-associated CXXCW motif protein [Oryzibacter oryziterrae]
MVRSFIACGVIVLSLAGTAAAGVPEPSGYRTEEYRAPVPDTLAGAHVLSTKEMVARRADGKSVLIDVLPKPPKPNLPKGTIFHLPPREDIPGSIWLPDVGYGELSAEMEAYFRDNLDKAVAGEHGRSVVFYCRSQCWMSWNAAKRAVSWGYTAVSWYPEGTDGWTAAGLPVEKREPVPRPGITE